MNRAKMTLFMNTHILFFQILREDMEFLDLIRIVGNI